ncbi:MAG: DUF192 domain-containing protein [Bryobacteraceae bacterium]|nr:DUF192 domain-containing protein [Bryobacteraceae bacterium]
MPLLIRNVTRNTVLATRAEVADTAAKRNTGLLKHSSLPKGEGLLIPTQAVHCFGMKFPIDVVFVNRKRQVLKVRPEMGRRAIAICLTAHAVLELPAGMIAETGTQKGDQLEFEKV